MRAKLGASMDTLARTIRTKICDFLPLQGKVGGVKPPGDSTGGCCGEESKRGAGGYAPNMLGRQRTFDVQHAMTV